MNQADPLQRDPHEPINLWFRPCDPPDNAPDLTCERLEFSSRGDRVPARLMLPPGSTQNLPVVVLQHGLHGNKEADYIEATASPWVRKGVAVATLDFPLHGERTSAKLSGALVQSFARLLQRPDAMAAEDVGLWLSFVRQSVADLQRLCDVLERHPRLDGSRLAYAGFSLGAILGSIFCGADPRPRAAALALGGGGWGPPEADPAQHIARFAPRPLLFVGARNDETIPRAATEALFEAAREPKALEWFDAGHNSLPGNALKSMWLFLETAVAKSR